MARIFYFVCHRLLVTQKELEENPLAGTYYVDDSPILGGGRTPCGELGEGIGLLKKLIDKKRETELRFSHHFPEKAFPRIKSAFRDYSKLIYANERGEKIEF
ncbi:MAG: hypothetical protein MUF61_01530 [archaeon]|jgi:hypothetical protein|nr:hypothetical protein [archaeon]